MISFIIPALNEHEGVAATVAECFELARRERWSDVEVIVVDDGSDDGTGEVSQEAGARVVRHPAPGGYGRSLKDGIRAARHDIIVTLDADGTYPLDELPKFLERYRQGFDLVVGRRTGPHYRELAMKSPLRLILQFLIEITTGQYVPDVNSGLRMFSRDVSSTYFTRLSERFSFSTSMTLAYFMTGRFVDYVEIGYRQRIGKSKVRLFRDALRTLQFIIQAILFYNPLKIFLLATAGCVLGAVVLMGFAYATGILTFFYLGIGFLLLSVLVFILGLLAVQLREIIHQ